MSTEQSNTAGGEDNNGSMPSDRGMEKDMPLAANSNISSSSADNGAPNSLTASSITNHNNNSGSDRSSSNDPLAMIQSLSRKFKTKSGSSGSSNEGQSDNSALVSLGNTSFGFNFDSEEGNSSAPNNSGDDSDNANNKDAKNNVFAKKKKDGNVAQLTLAQAAVANNPTQPATAAMVSQQSNIEQASAAAGNSSSGDNSNLNSINPQHMNVHAGKTINGNKSSSVSTLTNCRNGDTSVQQQQQAVQAGEVAAAASNEDVSDQQRAAAADAAAANLQAIASSFRRAGGGGGNDINRNKRKAQSQLKKEDMDEDEEDDDCSGYNTDDEGGNNNNSSGGSGSNSNNDQPSPQQQAVFNPASARWVTMGSNNGNPLSTAALAAGAVRGHGNASLSSLDNNNSKRGGSHGNSSSKNNKKQPPAEPDGRKREERNAREKERSFRISTQINELRSLLGNGGVVVPKGTKSSVLTEAANYIRMLQQHQYRSEIDRHQLVQQMQVIGSGAHGQQAADAIRHVAAQNGVWSLGNFGGVPPRSAMSQYNNSATSLPDVTASSQGDTTTLISTGSNPAAGPLKIDTSEYRFVFDTCGVGMAIASMGGAIIDCNQLFCQLSEFSKQEVCSLTIFNLTARQDLQHAFDLISQMISPPMDPSGEPTLTPKPIVLRGAMKARSDLGLSVALVKGTDGIAKCFCVTLIANPSSPFDTTKPTPVSFEAIAPPDPQLMLSSTGGPAAQSTKADIGAAPAYTAG